MRSKKKYLDFSSFFPLTAILTIALLICVKQSYAFDISGDYKGFYQYYDSKREDIVGHFIISIQQDGNIISGIIKEPRTDFGPKKPYLYSDFHGTVNGMEDSFEIEYIKIYRYDKHEVRYKGVYKSYLGEIQGEWNIRGYKGKFKVCHVQPLPDLDSEPPRIFLLKPDILSEVSKGSRVRAINVVRKGADEVAGLASDNVKVASVVVNGRRAYLSSPTVKEQNMMQGNVLRFSATVNLQEGENAIRIDVLDVNENSKRVDFVIRASPGVSHSLDTFAVRQKAVYQKKVAVVIGINNYTNWPPLECAVNDACAIKRYLHNQKYKILTLMDREATRTNILKTLGYELPRLCDPEDAALIYFAGHGHTENLLDGGKEGYIVPVDAGTSDCFLSAISMRQLRSIIQRIKAKHIMFLMDSCYSGLGFSRSAGVAKSESDYIHKVASFRAVQMITAGGMNEQAVEQRGHGIFTNYLLTGLTGPADLDKDGYITGGELGVYLRSSVSKQSNNRQTPSYGRLEGEGEFIFQLLGRE